MIFKNNPDQTESWIKINGMDYDKYCEYFMVTIWAEHLKKL